MSENRPALKNEEVAVRTWELSRRFGLKHAVRDLEFVLERGDICGFIGPNGAGKTTTLRMLATLLPPTGGRAEIFGYDVVSEADKVRRMIGFMPDQFGLYREMVVAEYLDFFGAAYSMPASVRKQVIADVLELTDLTEKADVGIASLSRGMQQRLSLARTLLHDPELLLLDEPASGLDPRARIEIRALLSELSKMNKTILISSHILTELAEMCNKVVIIEQGQNIFSGSLRALKQRLAPERVVHIQLKERLEEAAALLSAHEAVAGAEIEDGALRIALAATAEDASFLPRELVQAGFDLLSMSHEETDLEDAFLSLTEGRVS